MPNARLQKAIEVVCLDLGYDLPVIERVSPERGAGALAAAAG